jgi:uncharacterized protein (TIGR03083 family)
LRLVKLSPVYGDTPVLRLDGVVGDAATPLLRQRDRLADLVATFDDAQWLAPSRCDGWTVRDVIAHLASTNQFWVMSITAGASGTPTRVLTDFDPVATPAQLVEAVASWTPAETLEKFRRSNAKLRAAVEGLDEAAWSLPAEAPPGHLTIRLLALHALWDSWVHERDIALPLGLEPVVEPDEVVAALVYAAALAPAFAATRDADRSGSLEVVATEPAVRFVVEVAGTVVVHEGSAPAGAVSITGRAVDLVEGLSLRAPFAPPIEEDERWLIEGLAEVFDQRV